MPSTPVITQIAPKWWAVNIYFTGVEGALRVFYRHPGATEWAVLLDQPAITSPQLAGTLQQLTTYDFCIASVVGGVESDKSNVVTATTTKNVRD